MAAQLYRFHCTDGLDLVVDPRGRLMATQARMRAHAARVAHRLMGRAADVDWSGWHVEVYDADGRRVWVAAFGEPCGEAWAE